MYICIILEVKVFNLGKYKEDLNYCIKNYRFEYQYEEYWLEARVELGGV